MLAVQVSCDVLDRDKLSIHAIHSTREAAVAHL